MTEYMKIQGSKLCIIDQKFNSEDMEFSAIASTNFQMEGNHKVRVHLPAFICKKLSRDVLYVPTSEVPEKILSAVKSGEDVRLFMRNRKEILSSFTTMMKHDPDCIVLTKR